MDSEALDWIVQHGYIIMFLLMLVEGPVVTASGALGAALGYFNVFIVFAISFFANFLEDFAYYAMGRWGGLRALDKYGERVGIGRSHRDRAAGFVEHNLGKWLVFVKSVPLVSPPGLAVMGALGVPIRRFIWWDALIVALTSLFFVVIGYYSGKGFEALQRITQYGSLGLGAAFLLFIVLAQAFGRIARRITSRVRSLTTEEAPAEPE